MRTRCQRSGAKTTAVGTASQMMRAIPWPRRSAAVSTIPMIHTIARAGPTLGAQATTPTATMDATPAALHDRCATAPVQTSHGSSRCAMTTVGRPEISASRRLGASAQATAATARRSARSVNRVAANHPPRAASGRASTHSTTMVRDGAAGQSEPRRAITALHGSAGPELSQPSGRRPYEASAHSPPRVARIGARAPPPSTGQARSERNAITETTSAASTTHAPPPLKKCRSPRPVPAGTSSSRRWRSSVPVTRSGASCAHEAARSWRMPRRVRATAPGRTAAVTAAPHSERMRAGRLPRIAPSERSTASGSRLSQCSGTTAAGA